MMEHEEAGCMQVVAGQGCVPETARVSATGLGLFLETVPGYVLVRGEDLSILGANGFFHEHVGDPGRPCNELLVDCPDQCSECPSLSVLRTGRPIAGEWMMPLAGRMFEVYARPFEERGERLILELGLDVTDRVRAEEGLKRYARKLEWSNRELREFASVATRDLQEPVRKILAFCDRLTDRFGHALPSEGRDYLHRVTLATRRLQSIITSLVSYTRQTAKVEPFTTVDLGMVARDVVAELEGQVAKTGAVVEVGSLPVVEADQGQMRRMFQNLVGNSLKFRGEEAPRISIRCTTEQAGPDGEDEFCQIVIEDNGIGFDEQYLDRIFSPFTRLHGLEENEGVGLGLTVCRRIVERHGGRIHARSSAGQGATFMITLPVKQRGLAFKTA